MSRPLYAYAYAEVPFDDAIALLAQDPEGLLQTATDVSAAHGRDLLANLNFDIAGFEVGRDIVIELGEYDPVEITRAVIPLTWRAAKGHVLFPTVDARLEIAALSFNPPLVQVSLVGSYRPPMGTVGLLLDRLVDARLAEAVLHRFIHELASRLEALVQDPARANLVAHAQPISGPGGPSHPAVA